MRTMVHPDEAERPRNLLALLGLVLGLALGGAALYAVAGLPHLPAALPTWDAVVLTLRGYDLPAETLGYLLTTAAWMLWLWIVASILLRLLVAVAEVATRGAAWVSSLRALSDLVTLPFVRRMVDGALIALIVVNVAGRMAPTAAAAPLAPATTTAASAVQAWDAARDHAIAVDETPIRRQNEYTVQQGDTLWSISERFYGAGGDYPRLIDANVGRKMPDGRRFTRAGVLYPGWVLLVQPDARTSTESNSPSYYVVQEGDTLRGIAAHFLGDEARWPEVFDLNRSKTRLEDGRVLRDPDLIWPGLRLQLPQGAARGSCEQTPEAIASGGGGEPAVAMATPTVEARPTPVPAAPTRKPAPPPDGREAAKAPAAVVESQPPAEDGSGSSLPYGAAALVATAALAGASLVARRRVRRSLDEPPVRHPSAGSRPRSDFAEADFARTLARRLHGGDPGPIVSVAELALRFLAERGVSEVSVVVARQGRDEATLVLQGGLAEQARLLALAGELGARLGGSGRAELTADRDVALHLSGLKLATLVGSAALSATRDLRFLPLGALPRGETLYGNWHELGNVLVAGLPGGGAEVVLASLLGALAAGCHPEGLSLWGIADRHTIPEGLLGLPHWERVANPAEPEAVTDLLRQLREELIRRMKEAEEAEDVREGGGRGGVELPEVVLAVGNLADLEDGGGTLELIGIHGPANGVRIVAATTRPDALVGLPPHFGARLVLQTLDDESSILLLGEPGAADLGTGEILLRIDGRVPLRARGFRLSPGGVEELVRLTAEAHGAHTRGVRGPGARAEEAVCSSGAGMEGQEPTMDAVGPAATLQDTTEDGTDREAEGEAEEDRSGEDRPQDPMREGVAASTGAGEELEDGVLLRVRCFGEFAVTDGDHEISPAGEEGTSFKAWEVLAFLAAQPDGTAPRDKLLAALWPEVDTDRAANRMRVAMARLRALLAHQVPGLPPEAVRCERDGTCHLDTGLISSDVHRFVALCRSASRLPRDAAEVALQQARAIYGGDLLPGRGRAYYAWVDERGDDGVSLREGYREEYYRATQALARLFSQGGRPDLAVPLYKDLLRAEPTLEDVVRELYRCYRQLGDLSSLIREDRHLRQALQEAYYDPEDPEEDADAYAPGPETVELFNRVRAELRAKDAPSGAGTHVPRSGAWTSGMGSAPSPSR